MIIDVHAHIIVPEVLREHAAGETWRPRVFRQDGRQVVEHGGRQITAAVREFVDIAAILRAYTGMGVAHVVLSPWVNLLRFDAEPAEGLRSCRLQNEALAALATRYPDRVSVLGAVPLQDPRLAARELEGVMRLPGLRGVEVAASVGGVTLGDERFRPFWEAAEGTGALVFIHPASRGFELPALNDYYLWNTVGNPLETAITAAQMVMAGVMESYPRLRVMLAHGGGALLALRGRLRHAHAFQPQARSRLRESPETSLRRFYFDTITHDARLLRDLVEFAGPDHVALGTDYPFDMGVDDPVGFIHSAGLGEPAEQQVLGGTAGSLLGLASRSPA